MFSKLKWATISFIVILAVSGAATAMAAEGAIAPGDVVKITVMGEADLSKQIAVGADGNVSLLLVKEFHIAGLTPVDAAGQLTQVYAKWLKNPQVSVEVVQPAKRQVMITGQVKTPGSYPIDVQTRLMQALGQAGGFLPDADIAKITVTSGQETKTYDIKEFLAGGNPDANVLLQDSDTINVPELNPTIGMVNVSGEVLKGGDIPLKKGLTVKNVLALAGGVSPQADISNATLTYPDGRTLQIDIVKAVNGDAGNDVEVTPNSRLYVPPAVMVVNVLGPVNKPGQIPMHGNMTVTEAIALAGGPTTKAKMSNVQILRKGLPKAIKVDVASIAKGGQDVALVPNDTIFVGESSSFSVFEGAKTLLYTVFWFLK